MENLFSLSKLMRLFFSTGMLVGMCFYFHVATLQATTSPFNFTASVGTDLQLTLSGGSNEKGKRTLLLSNAIQFGKVSFVKTDAMTTGDAYLNNGSLMLEAIIDTATVFNGTSQVSLQLSKNSDSANAFHQVYYSLAKSRSQPLEKVKVTPSKNLLKTIRKSTDFSVRIVFEIAPQQKGEFYDELKLEATSI